jgi:hypothetical protein
MCQVMKHHCSVYLRLRIFPFTHSLKLVRIDLACTHASIHTTTKAHEIATNVCGPIAYPFVYVFAIICLGKQIAPRSAPKPMRATTKKYVCIHPQYLHSCTVEDVTLCLHTGRCNAMLFYDSLGTLTGFVVVTTTSHGLQMFHPDSC